MVTQFFEATPLNSHFMSIFPNQDAVLIYIYMFAILLLDAEMNLSWSIKGLSSHRHRQ